MSRPADDAEGFLTRWSRRKRQTGEPAATIAAPPASVPAEAPPEPVEPEPVEPPSLDLIDKDFDLAPWLKQNVPESWKLAALRRAWESDPAIANFENPARDYALDWNTPGGAPGYGPLTESDDVGAMVRAIFGEPPPEPAEETVAEASIGDSMPHRLSSETKDEAMNDAAQQQVALSPVRPDADEASAAENGAETAKISPKAHAALRNDPGSQAVPVRIRKRGGGATPV